MRAKGWMEAGSRPQQKILISLGQRVALVAQYLLTIPSGELGRATCKRLNAYRVRYLYSWFTVAQPAWVSLYH